MSHEITVEQILANWVFQKHQWIKQKLFQPLRDEYGDVNTMDDVLKKEMIEHARWVLCTQIVLDQHISSDAALDFISNLNLEELLK